MKSRTAFGFRCWSVFIGGLIIITRGDGMETTTGADLMCEAGWDLREAECVSYVYAKQQSTFDQALMTCNKFNAVLPIVHSQMEWNHRLAQISPHAQGDVWLGLRYKPQNSSFRWMDGSTMDWSNFQISPFPVNRTRTNCVYASRASNFTWFVQDCLSDNYFVCIKNAFPRTTPAPTVRAELVNIYQTTQQVTTSATIASTGSTAVLPVCAHGTESGCVWNQSTVTWKQASENCQQQNRTLIFTTSKEDWIKFQETRVSYSNLDNVWIGLWYNHANGRIELWDGNGWSPSGTDWYPWAPGQPPPSNTFTGDRCVVSKKDGDYTWEFGECNQSNCVGLCQEKMDMVYTTISTHGTSRPVRKWTFRPTVHSSPMSVTTNTSSSTKPKRSFTPRPMSQAERISSIVIQSMGCAFIIGGLSLTMALFVLFRNMSVEKIIIVNEDLALLLAHIFVLTLREPALYPRMSPQLCKFVAILLHYFFTCGYTFMLLEALQMLYIVGHVYRSGAILPTYAILLIGWGCPLGLVAVSGPVVGDEYVTYWTCWGDLERRFSWALFFPMVCVCSCTVIIVESAGMMSRQDPPYDADPVQLFSTRVSQRGIVIVMSLTIASHTLGVVAVFFQIVYLYVVCFGLNVSCGVAVVFFHTAVDSKIRATVVKIWRKIRHCGRRQYTVTK